MMEIRKGDVLLANLSPVVGSEQGGARPCVVIQNDIGNKTSSTTIVAPVTSKIYSKQFMTNVDVKKKESGLKIDSTILLNQIKTVDKRRILRRISRLDYSVMMRVDNAIRVSLGLV